jgi:thymidylate synthase (FAD)
VVLLVGRVADTGNVDDQLIGCQLITLLVCHKGGCDRYGFNLHWSPFDQADLTIEVETSLPIAVQMIRHWTAKFQQFSQRYADVNLLGEMVEPIKLRFKAEGGNRQGSGEDVPDGDWRQAIFEDTIFACVSTYNKLIEGGVAPESARFVLPLAVKTRFYMKASVRTWIHYFELRCDSHTQKEHQQVANAIRKEFANHFPTVMQAIEINS